MEWGYWCYFKFSYTCVNVSHKFTYSCIYLLYRTLFLPKNILRLHPFYLHVYVYYKRMFCCRCPCLWLRCYDSLAVNPRCSAVLSYALYICFSVSCCLVGSLENVLECHTGHGNGVWLVNTPESVLRVFPWSLWMERESLRRHKTKLLYIR